MKIPPMFLLQAFALFKKKNNLLFWFICIFFAVYYFILYRAFNQEFSAFGCFDECFNYMGGYFMLKGRYLYKDIFFNHQPLMAYISFGIQSILHPSSIYHLVLYHRMFVFFIALLMNILLILRFRYVGVGFALFFETTKFFFMGSLFLAESIIVYPLVYILGIVFFKLSGKKIFPFDIIISTFFTFLVIFMREPFLITAVLLFLLILWGRDMIRIKIITFFTFILLSLFFILSLSIKDYIYQVFHLNLSGIIKSEIQENRLFGSGLLKVFLYPFVVLYEGEWTFIRKILIGLDILFLYSIISIFLKNKRNLFTVFIVFLVLGFSNVRLISPGVMYYGSFHMLVWYGLFIFSVFLFLSESYRGNKDIIFRFFLFLLIFSFFTYITLSSESFLKHTVNREKQFISNFDHYYFFGEAVRLLSKEKDTVFIDGGNDLLYWQTNLESSYKYAFYGAKGNVVFDAARIDMFRQNPPDFYYYYLCSGKESGFPELLTYQKNNYIAINYLNKPCLYVKRTKLLDVLPDTWEKLQVLGFSR